MNKRLKIGVMVDSPMVSKYLLGLIKWSLGRSDIDCSHLIIKPRPVPGERVNPPALVRIYLFFRFLLFRVLESFEALILGAMSRRFGKHLARFDVGRLFKRTMNLDPLGGDFQNGYYLSSADVRQIEDEGFDLLIWFGSGILRGPILNAARFGVVSMRYADDRLIRRGPVGFWEVYLRKKLSGFVIYRLTNEEEGGEVLVRKSFPTKGYFVLNQAHLYVRSNHALKDFLIRLARTQSLQQGGVPRAMTVTAYSPPELVLQLRYLARRVVPWRVQRFVEVCINRVYYYRTRLYQAYSAPVDGGVRVHFFIPDYGVTGGALAIINTANLLAEQLFVSFERTPGSDRNRHLSKRVWIDPGLNHGADAVVIESGSDYQRVTRWLAERKAVVVSNHGFPQPAKGAHRGYGYEHDEIVRMLSVVTGLHFISAVQHEKFLAIGWEGARSEVIPNYVRKVQKKTRTQNVGMVCDARLPLKNAERAVQAGEASDAALVQVWGRYDKKFGSERVLWQGFETDKEIIYDSFDVLILISFTEVQPLCVLEAISCGIPCVLSDIDCYAEFRGIEGFWFVDPHDVAAAAAAVNKALACPQSVRTALVELWQEKYSPEANARKWVNYLTELKAIAVAQPESKLQGAVLAD